MNKYYLLYLIWLLPAYMLFITVQQGLVYQGAVDTFNHGEDYVAEVTDFDVKQIASQSNAYVSIRFETDNEIINRRHTLSIQMAQQIMESPTIAVKFQKGAFQEIVLVPTYSLQKSTSLFNISIAIIGLITTLLAALLVHRYTTKKLNNNQDTFVIERVDS
ncbi:MAG: hypothetical protein FH748_00415 [Balneolaceae bacterium]|nr:hypothetical protein [Balneolaceae bacterium]